MVACMRIKRVPNSPNPGVHHVTWTDNVRPCLGVGESDLGETSDAGSIVNGIGIGIDDTAVPMVSVLAEADICKE